MSEEKKEKIRRVNVASGVVIKGDNKYLLVQEKKPMAYKLWNLPAGKVEEGLTIEENAIKEAEEETGYKVRLIRRIGIFHENDHKAVKHAFEAVIVGGKLKFPKDEILDAKWFTYDEIKKMKDKLRADWVLSSIEILEKGEKENEYLDNWKRCQADFENYKKDQAKMMNDFKKFASLDMILQILPVLDNFNVSLEHVPEKEKDSAWVMGIIYIKKQLEEVLKNNGVEEIEVKAGDKFDPEVHEAISEAPAKGGSASGGNATNKISKIVQKGYKIDPARNATNGVAGGGKVIRPVRVIVE